MQKRVARLTVGHDDHGPVAPGASRPDRASTAHDDPAGLDEIRYAGVLPGARWRGARCHAPRFGGRCEPRLGAQCRAGHSRTALRSTSRSALWVPLVTTVTLFSVRVKCGAPALPNFRLVGGRCPP